MYLENCPFHPCFPVLFNISFVEASDDFFFISQILLLCLPFHFWLSQLGHCPVGFHWDKSSQVRAWTTEANSFWDRKKPRSFWDRHGFRHQTSGQLHARGEVFTLPGRVLPEHLREPSWFQDSSKTSLCRWECGLQKLTASGTGRRNTDSGTGPVLGLHLLPEGRSESQIFVYLPCKRRACLQRGLWPLKLRRELVSQVCW